MWQTIDRGVTEARRVTDRSPDGLHATIDDATDPIPGDVRGRPRWDPRP